MFDKQLLETISAIQNEIVDLNKRLERITTRETRIVKDSVKGSSPGFPYIQHSCVVEGVEYPKGKKTRYTYRKQIKDKKRRLEKLINQLEYQLNYIEDKDSEIRQIIRYKYEDNLTWLQIMFKMNYNSESTAKLKLKRFLEKIENVTNVTV